MLNFPQFIVDFSDREADWSICVHDTRTGKHKPMQIGDFVTLKDETGNLCYGVVTRKDDRTRLFWAVLDRTTWQDASLT